MAARGQEQLTSLLCNCETCGREVFVPVVGIWAYKKRDHLEEKRGVVKYFCGWNCMRKYEKQYEEEKAKRIQDGLRKRERRGSANAG